MQDFFKLYFEYAKAGINEPPNTFHRWTALSLIGSLLGRQTWFPFGHSEIYPNQYIMLMGEPGTRKSTAINVGTKLLKKLGYTRFAADRTSKERFLMDMKQTDTVYNDEDLEALELDGPAESYIVAEEFTDFTGAGNIDFLTCLTKLWDNVDEYKHPKIHGKSVSIYLPTVNILSGNTLQNFTLAFPPEAIGNGFLSRLIFIYGESTGRKITFPEPPDPLILESCITILKEMRATIKGPMEVSHNAKLLCDDLYIKFKGIDDPRFKNYATRRFTHLLKIAIILAASELSLTIRDEHLLKANTVLYYAEVRMPKALGEYGRSKYSEASGQIMAILNKATSPVTIQHLWKIMAKDLTKMSELLEIVKNLQHAGKIQTMTLEGKQGLMPRHEIIEGWSDSLLIPEWLTLEERI